MDAITLLKDDHKQVEQLFKRFEKAGDRAIVEKRQVVDRIIEELSQHAAIEEQIFYPVARSTVPDTEDTVLESLEEHHIVKWLLSELTDLDPTDERFDAKVTVLIENVRHHVVEEENDFFPKVRAELSRNALAEMGEALANAKSTAPTHPHPKSPDTPPGNLVTGLVSGVVDRVGDAVSGVAQGGVSAAQDLIARIRHASPPKSSPRGTRTARTKATEVRRASATATNGAQKSVRTAKSGARKTVRTAKSGARKTVRTAKSGAKKTASTARSGARSTTNTAKSGARSTANSARRTATRTAAAARTSR